MADKCKKHKWCFVCIIERERRVELGKYDGTTQRYRVVEFVCEKCGKIKELECKEVWETE